jgi:hypothetical protein
MISFPLYSLLFIYFLFLAIFVIFFLTNLYHIFEAAAFSKISFFFTFLIFAFAAVTIFFTFDLLSGIDWQQQVIIYNPN